MNLSEVFNVALPELPARRTSKAFPRLHPKIIAREHIEGGVPTVIAMIAGTTSMFYLPPEQWRLLSLFDGQRSFAEVAGAYSREMGSACSEEDVRNFASQLDEAGLFYKATLDLNTTANQKLTEERQRRVQKKINLAHMTFSTWDPDIYLTKLYNFVGFVYSKWFVRLTLVMFALMTVIFVSGFGEIWRDTVEYYTFTHKSAVDLAQFWLLFCGLGFFHESAHGLTCKHYGGGVHRMGFMLLYLSPCFFVDVTEVYVYGGKWQRIAAIIAGIWVELMFCSAASVIWWGTPIGSPAHDFAYKIMLITGVAVVLMNLNPLIKLDGYYLFSELIGISTLKESSTEYVLGWVKHNVFRMPVEVPYVRPQRRLLFAAYAILSGLYSYVILFAVVRFAYNLSFRISSQWAFLPALLLGVLIFRSRLQSLARFARDFYLDKKQAWSTVGMTRRKIVLAAILLLGLFAPLWRETVDGRFVIEPAEHAVIRASVPGEVVEVTTDEGLTVAAGSPLLSMRNIGFEEIADRSLNDLKAAEAGVRKAELSYRDLSRAQSEQTAQIQRYRSISQRAAALRILSPISGVVMTPRIRNLKGSFVAEGTELAEVAGTRTLKARIFVPDFEVHKLSAGAPVSLKLVSQFRPVLGRLDAVSSTPLELPPGLIHVEQYKGIAPPPFYVATVLVPNLDGVLRFGMSGDAKIEVKRHSCAWFFWENAREFVQRKIW